MVKQFLIMKYQKMNIEVPADPELQEHAGRIVDDAHRVARERGSNVLTILKELANNYLKPKQ